MNFGVGPGWINQEMRNHGTDPATRWKVMRERVEAMKEIWADDVAAYAAAGVDRVLFWVRHLGPWLRGSLSLELPPFLLQLLPHGGAVGAA
ncbi:hypothetical protein [Nonomuraea sp. NPDC049400]|uniref:hypothetical protein n=1 Tax=Nonomuraea sp. NPDC049400 TaxID=3364352 RepID=UPI00379F74EC